MLFDLLLSVCVGAAVWRAMRRQSKDTAFGNLAKIAGAATAIIFFAIQRIF
jgi:hypothetical protein